MAPDEKTIQTLVEIITHEVLQAYENADKPTPQGAICKVETADGIVVQTCFDEHGRVVGAGAERLTTSLGFVPQDPSIASYIDHTLLKPEATPDQIATLCEEASTYKFASVSVNPVNVQQCADLLRGSSVKVCSVIGFPLGATMTEVKVYETVKAMEHGANEIDMVINIGALKARKLDLVARDIREIVNAVHERGGLLKVIIETALLTDEEKVIACLLAKEAGADFVKTSTGFSTGGATIQDVALMRRVVGPTIGVKAAGGIHSREDAENMVSVGATRLGASAGVKIIKGEAVSGSY
ncbi:MAG: deoxyribose-phosphate aldolase [Anaerolineaceae bacterium]|nr:deoxyribose-phosphate aldolase [Anaerolineaceae bacterium]